MGDPTPSYAALMPTSFWGAPTWTGWCALCVTRLPRRRWWQRGLLAPLPLCPGGCKEARR